MTAKSCQVVSQIILHAVKAGRCMVPLYGHAALEETDLAVEDFPVAVSGISNLSAFVGRGSFLLNALFGRPS